jgi:hypothetical protein
MENSVPVLRQLSQPWVRYYNGKNMGMTLTDDGIYIKYKFECPTKGPISLANANRSDAARITSVWVGIDPRNSLMLLYRFYSG